MKVHSQAITAEMKNCAPAFFLSIQLLSFERHGSVPTCCRVRQRNINCLASRNRHEKMGRTIRTDAEEE
jgi:hypothetical protein